MMTRRSRRRDDMVHRPTLTSLGELNERYSSRLDRYEREFRAGGIGTGTLIALTFMAGRDYEIARAKLDPEWTLTVREEETKPERAVAEPVTVAANNSR